jgi:Na+/glutamate symporter
VLARAVITSVTMQQGQPLMTLLVHATLQGGHGFSAGARRAASSVDMTITARTVVGSGSIEGAYSSSL